MSSHHIVKEKQEPALYIDYFGSFDEELLGQLLEWSPTLLVHADEYEKALSLGLKVDFVVGPKQPTELQENTGFLLAMQSEIETAVNYLIGEKYEAVNIIGRTNKFDDIAHLVPKINIVRFTRKGKSYPVKSGFSIWKPAQSIFKIDIISYFETDNLKQKEGSEEDFEVIKDGFVKFEFDTDYLFIGEPL